MGKYMRKARAAGEVAVMEVAQAHQPPLGVRTRSRTVALLKNNTSTNCDSTAYTAAGDYLQLRSRRLEKASAPRPKHIDRDIARSKRNAAAAAIAEEVEETVQNQGSSIEEWVEMNVLDTESRSRNSREATPCGLIIRDSHNISTPGSTSRPSSSTTTDRRSQFSMPSNILTAFEMEEFFSGAEYHQQQKFIEKYNFDPVSDIPLPGRYEWVRVDS